MNKTNDFLLADAIDVIEEVLGSGGEFKLYPKGVSMLPLIVEGKDAVILKKCETKPQKYDMLLYRREDGHFVLHRVMKLCDDGSLAMCGDNQFFMERGVSVDAVVGRVGLIYKGENKLTLDSAKYKRYLFFKIKLPFRRIFLRIKNFCMRAVRKISGK